MSALDLVLSLLVVAAAAAFLVWQLALRRRAPACHSSKKPARVRSLGVQETRAAPVLLDDKLARALAKAQRKRA